MSAIDSNGGDAKVSGCPLLSFPLMPVSEFPELLGRLMRRIRASAADVASEIGMSREAVNNWRQGHSLPNRKHRDKVLACAGYLRLTEVETNRLLGAAGFDPEFPTEATAASGSPSLATPAAVGQLLDRLQQMRPYPIIMLLTQAHWGQPPEREAMLAEAARRYGQDKVLHLQPPFSLHSDPAAYFSALGSQCGLTGVDSDYAFEAALGRTLQQPDPLFCLVSRFEQGDPAQRDVLAGILRSLSEMHSGRLHLLICGGAALADLKYQGGDLSLLNIAATEMWPELTTADLRRQACASDINDNDCERALRLSGGHPLLATAAMALLGGAGASASDEQLIEQLASYAPVWQAFVPLLADPANLAAIEGWLRQERLAAAYPYLLDPVLRSLYWANLVTPRRHGDGLWLEWRCEAIRRAGLLIARHGHSLER